MLTDFTFQFMDFISDAYYEQSSTNSRKKLHDQDNIFILPYHPPGSIPRKNLLETATTMGEISTFL